MIENWKEVDSQGFSGLREDGIKMEKERRIQRGCQKYYCEGSSGVTAMAGRVRQPSAGIPRRNANR